MTADLESRLKLAPGERLELEDVRTTGTWGETDHFRYRVVNASGQTIGAVVHTDHTSQNGLRRSQSVVQRDSSGQVIVEADW